MDDDTIVFTEADRLELLTMLDCAEYADLSAAQACGDVVADNPGPGGAAASPHTCTPRWWPHRLGETWQCSECGHVWVTDVAANIVDSARAIALGLLDPLTLGWRTA